MSRRKITFATVLLVGHSLSLCAQQAAVQDSWSQVRALPEHAHLKLVSDRGKARCTLTRVTEGQVVCEDRAYARPEILSVKVVRHGASTVRGLLIGAGVGIGAGAIVGAALGNSAFSTPGRGAAVGIAIFAPVGAVAGAVAGRAGDGASKTVYQR